MESDSHQEPEKKPKSGLLETPANRRTFLKIAGAGLLAAGGIGGKILTENSPTETESQSPPKTTPDVTPEPTSPPETTDDAEFGEDADLETARYLYSLYGDAMNDIDYPLESDKKRFTGEVTKIANRLNPENTILANQLFAVMHFESSGTFSPSVKNLLSGATGLIQFMENTAEGLGTTLEELEAMSPMKQLTYVEKFLQSQADAFAIPYTDLSDVYLAVLNPANAGNDFDHTLFQNGELAYEQNAVLDLDNNGKITIGEATESVAQEAIERMNEREDFLFTPESIEKRHELNERIACLDAIRELEPDYERLHEIAAANSRIIENPPDDALAMSNGEFGDGWGLLGVRLTLDSVYKDNKLHEDLSGIPSAYLAADVLAEHTDKFKEISIETPAHLHILPVGSIIVFKPNTQEDTGYPYDNGHGKISIVKPNAPDGTSINGSDHEFPLDEELEQMNNGFRVFIASSSAENQS